MASPNIDLMGAVYPTVSGVTLPKHGGGTATFPWVEGSQTITQNNTYDVSSLAEVVVNVSGGGGGGETASSKDVNFIDYDGTIRYSYTAEEFAALTAMPANPSHTGLTAQGWNWSLSDAKAQLAAMPDAGLTIGQMYITDDGKTRIYCHFEQGRLAPYLGLGVKGTVIVDWGDGSNTDTLTGTSLSIAKTVQHTYTAEGDYTIILTVSSGRFAFFGVSSAAHILKKSTATSSNISRVYVNCIRRVELGASVSVGTYAFYYCCSLSSITIPNSVTSIGSNAFNGCYSLSSITISDSVTSISAAAFSNCYSLSSITIPNSVTSIGSNAFNGCYSLSSITIPNSVTSISNNVFANCYSLSSITISDSVTSISNNVFSNCYSLSSITIPNSVTSISNNVFSSCYGLAEFHFLSATPPTVANSSAFNNVQTDCIIYVPTGSLSAYTSATNYPSSSTYTYVEE